MTERKALFDAIFVGWMNQRGASQGTTAFGIFRLEQVPLAGAGTQHLSARRNLKALGHRFLGFDAFRTSHNQKLSTKEQAI